ncbi:MAG TPA: AAA family ATPase [Anaerolineae bacterium]|nr:AAA family ATPase [Anaerolineae bacterium]
MDLFEHNRNEQMKREAPLAHRLRPRNLNEYVGQGHIVGPGRLLRRAIEADQLSSLIFYGPPGTGKTTLASVIANTTKSHFIRINAVLDGVKQIREAIEEAHERRSWHNQKTTLFVDEVHRWSKSQQDALLPHVENGTVVLIGATTENPYFEVNKALVSRSRIFQLKPLTEQDLRQIGMMALRDKERGYGERAVHMTPAALDHLVAMANGDARGVLNAIELAVETTPPNDNGLIHIDLSVAEESIQRRAVLYDKDGDAHYDTISAFIKSVRGSDPDAALYWLAKMVYAGEDPRFIFRRLAILAGEDVGLADPQAAVVVQSCWDLYERIGLPEGRFPLAQATLYLATCPKSNSTLAFFDALAAVEQENDDDVPNHLKDSNRDGQSFGHGWGYLYPHAYRDHWVAQQYLPTGLQGRMFYQPSNQGYEAKIALDVTRRREAQLAAMFASSEGSIPEVLTFSPSDRARDAWLQRTLSLAGYNYGHLRDQLFAQAQVRRHHVVLDLQANTGLLTWEAVRLTPEGGVWALADETHSPALEQWGQRLPPLMQPIVLTGELTDLADLLAEQAPPNLRFDHMMGRNLDFAWGERERLLNLWAGIRPWLAAEGQLTLLQTVPARGQRLYRLVDWTGVNEDLVLRVEAAEEMIYGQEGDGLVNWNEEEMVGVLTAVGFSLEAQTTLRPSEQRRLSSSHLERWFGEGSAERPSYRYWLGQGDLSEAEVAAVEKLYRQQLTGAAVTWHTGVVLVQFGFGE